MAAGPGGKYIVTGGVDFQVKVWSPEGTPMVTSNHHNKQVGLRCQWGLSAVAVQAGRSWLLLHKHWGSVGNRAAFVNKYTRRKPGHVAACGHVVQRQWGGRGVQHLVQGLETLLLPVSPQRDSGLLANAGNTGWSFAGGLPAADTLEG